MTWVQKPKQNHQEALHAIDSECLYRFANSCGMNANCPHYQVVQNTAASSCIYFCCFHLWHIWQIRGLNILTWFAVTHFRSFGFFLVWKKSKHFEKLQVYQFNNWVNELGVKMPAWVCYLAFNETVTGKQLLQPLEDMSVLIEVWVAEKNLVSHTNRYTGSKHFNT